MWWRKTLSTRINSTQKCWGNQDNWPHNLNLVPSIELLALRLQVGKGYVGPRHQESGQGELRVLIWRSSERVHLINWKFSRWNFQWVLIVFVYFFPISYIFLWNLFLYKLESWELLSDYARVCRIHPYNSVEEKCPGVQGREMSLKGHVPQLPTELICGS